LEIILFEWLIGSTDRHAGNVMFTGKKQPWKLFDHGASFGVGARGNRASGKPHMRLGALNVLFESYIANKLPDLTSTQIKQSYGQVRPIVPESYGLLYIGEQTLEKIIKMGDTVLIRLDEATAPKSYTQYILSGLGHLKRLRKLGADKVSFADLIAAPEQKKKAVKKRKKRKKPKKKAIKPAPKSTEPKIDKPEFKSKSIVRETKNLTVNKLFSELKDLYIQNNRSYPFANSKEASVVYENLVEHVKERTDFKATALEMSFETWIAHLDLNSDETAENQAKALYLKIKEAYQKLYGVDLSGEEKTVKALTVEALVEGPQGVDVKLESVESEKAYEFAYYIRERLTKLGINLLAPVQKKKVKQKKHRALTVGRAKVL
ncbi:MAG: hypothetical protein ACPG77_18880, partial [Nannocystaceae bacterium]